MDASKKAAIVEMASSEGWRILEEMLKYDERFAVGILNRPKFSKATKESPNPEPEWVTEPHDLGRARGILGTAQKYLNLVRSARERANQD